MKRILLILTVAIIAVSCGKWNGSKKHDTVYYTEDFKDIDMTVMGVNSSEMAAYWTEFYQKNPTDKDSPYTRYSTIVKTTSGVLYKETGSCVVNWGVSAQFIPENGESYEATFTYEKEKYALEIDGKDGRSEIIFVYKVQKQCGFKGE